MALTTGKIVELMLDTYLDTYESQQDLLPLVNFVEPDPGSMQNADNWVWRRVKQHAPVLTGWDLSGQETGIIEETYPAYFGDPTGDFPKVRADGMRDKRFWEDRAKVSAERQASYLNAAIATAVTNQGSIFYRSNATSGFDFISLAKTIMNERQGPNNGRSFILNDRDSNTFAQDLAARQTLQGRPADTWAIGQIGRNVAGFDVYEGSFLPNLDGGADPATTVTGNHTFAPEAGSVSSTGVVTNVDYRVASIVVADSSSYTVGDKVQFENSGTPVYSIGRDDKNTTLQAMTFTVVEITDSTHIKVYPKPIAVDDTGNLTTLELAYANVDTRILNAATVNRLNTDTNNRANIFFDKMAVEVNGGTIPAELFAQFAGMKTVSSTMKNGLKVYMVYDGDIATMTFRYRMFTWYGVTIASPSDCGVAVTY